MKIEQILEVTAEAREKHKLAELAYNETMRDIAPELFNETRITMLWPENFECSYKATHSLDGELRLIVMPRHELMRYIFEFVRVRDHYQCVLTARCV